MSMQFRGLAEQAMADGAITADEILSLRQGGWANATIDADEADAIFVLNDHLAEPTAEWSDFFVEALSEYIVHRVEPRGYVSEDQAEWLIERIERDSGVESLTELELLVKVLEKAINVPDRLKAYALDQIEQAVLTGEGPTRDGGALEAGNVTDAEARLLRRMVFAGGGDRPAGVSQREANMLFRVKDATLGANNSPDWKRLFVQGVGNYLQGFGGKEQLSRERAAELENFMNQSAPSIGGFFGRMFDSIGHSGVGEGFAAIRAEAAPPLHIELEAADAAEVTPAEHSWLQPLLDADGGLDELEKALLDFLAEEEI
jgi:hypothetical protein